VFRFIGKILMGIVITGLILALLRAFNFDLFGLSDWLIAWIINILTTVSDFFSGNATFQKVVEAPIS
jgi:hypothetical protein